MEKKQQNRAGRAGIEGGFTTSSGKVFASSTINNFLEKYHLSFGHYRLSSNLIRRKK